MLESFWCFRSVFPETGAAVSNLILVRVFRRLPRRPPQECSSAEVRVKHTNPTCAQTWPQAAAHHLSSRDCCPHHDKEFARKRSLNARISSNMGAACSKLGEESKSGGSGALVWGRARPDELGTCRTGLCSYLRSRSTSVRPNPSLERLFPGRIVNTDRRSALPTVSARGRLSTKSLQERQCIDLETTTFVDALSTVRNQPC